MPRLLVRGNLPIKIHRVKREFGGAAKFVTPICEIILKIRHLNYFAHFGTFCAKNSLADGHFLIQVGEISAFLFAFGQRCQRRQA